MSDNLEAIVAELKSKDQNVRDAAIEKLEQMDAAVLGENSEFIVEPLVAAARWGHEYKDDASRSAVRVLVKMGESAAPVLLKLTEDDNYVFSQIACIVLAKLGNSNYAADARAKLGAYIERDNEYHARDAIKAMVEISDQYVVDYLILNVLKTHTNEHIRSSAAIALGQIGDKRAISALTEALQDPSWQNVQPAAKWAVQRLKRLSE